MERNYSLVILQAWLATASATLSNSLCHALLWRERLFLYRDNPPPCICCEGWWQGTWTPKAFHSWFCCLIILWKSFSWQCRVTSSAAEPEGLLPLQKVSPEVSVSRWDNAAAHMPFFTCFVGFSATPQIKKCAFHIVFRRQRTVFLLCLLLLVVPKGIRLYPPLPSEAALPSSQLSSQSQNTAVQWALLYVV